jgi:regulator of sigma E protease
MYRYGFRDGDKILALNGVDQLDFDEINKDLILDDVKIVTVERFGERRDLELPDDFGQMVVDSNVRIAFAIRFPCVVDSVIDNTPAKVAGLIKGDSLVGVNSFYSPYFQDIQRQIIKHKGKTITLHLVRDGRQIQLPVAVSNEGTIGFGPKDLSSYFEKTKREYTLAQAFPAGVHEAWNKITDYTSQLRFLFSKSGAKQVGGFVTFAKLFPSTWNWPAFWLLTAWISVVLAFMNILPIPALDGGHVMFLLWEMITGKAVSQKVLERAQMVGLVLLLSLMVYANGMDIFRIFSK